MSVHAFQITVVHPLSAWREPLTISFDNLGSLSSILLIGVLGLSIAAQPARIRTRMESFALLVAVSFGIAACTADNLPTLTLAWAGSELMLVIIRFARVHEEGAVQARRGIRTGMASVTALLLATLLSASNEGGADISMLGGLQVSFFLVFLAALLRIAPYPLPAALNRRWQVHIISLITGGCLLLRLTPMSPAHLALLPWLLPIVAITYLVTALLAALPPDWSDSLPYVLAAQVATALLGPLLDAEAGSALAAMALCHAVIAIGILRIDMEVRPYKPLGKKARIPLAIAAASLAGWPLTLGFVINWALVALCLSVDRSWLALSVGVLSSLISVSVWQRILWIRHEIVPAHLASRPTRAAVACGLLLAIPLVLTGAVVKIAPMWLSRVPLPGFAALAHTLSWRGSAGQSLTLAFALMITFPPLVGLAMNRIKERSVRVSARAADVVGSSLDLEWLYIGIITLFSRAGAVAVRALASIEESLFLTWTLLWGLIVVLLLVGQ